MRMMKVTLAIAALAAAPLASARAEEAVHEVKATMVGGGSDAAASGAKLAADAGWNSTWALLFQLISPFNAAGDLLKGFGPTDSAGAAPEGGLGLMYNLGSDMAARMSAFYYRTSSPAQVTKTIEENAADRVETYTMTNPLATGTPTAVSSFMLRADMLLRLTQDAIAPYAGGGLFYDWRQVSFDRKDDVTNINEIDERYYRTRDQNFGLRGLLGAEWRVHSNFAIFAEYALSMNLLKHHSLRDETITTVKAADGSSSAAHKLVTSATPGWLGFSSTLTNEFNVGLAVHFK